MPNRSCKRSSRLSPAKPSTVCPCSPFGLIATTLAVATMQDGGATVDIDQASLGNDLTSITGASDLATLAISHITCGIEAVATLRAENGAQSNRLSFASDLLVTNKENLEAANSRIIDVDVAQESTQLARMNILVQAGASILGQANASSQIALQLLD